MNTQTVELSAQSREWLIENDNLVIIEDPFRVMHACIMREEEKVTVVFFEDNQEIISYIKGRRPLSLKTERRIELLVCNKVDRYDLHNTVYFLVIENSLAVYLVNKLVRIFFLSRFVDEERGGGLRKLTIEIPRVEEIIKQLGLLHLTDVYATQSEQMIMYARVRYNEYHRYLAVGRSNSSVLTMCRHAMYESNFIDKYVFTEELRQMYRLFDKEQEYTSDDMDVWHVCSGLVTIMAYYDAIELREKHCTDDLFFGQPRLKDYQISALLYDFYGSVCNKGDIYSGHKLLNTVYEFLKSAQYAGANLIDDIIVDDPATGMELSKKYLTFYKGLVTNAQIAQMVDEYFLYIYNHMILGQAQIKLSSTGMLTREMLDRTVRLYQDLRLAGQEDCAHAYAEVPIQITQFDEAFQLLVAEYESTFARARQYYENLPEHVYNQYLSAINKIFVEMITPPWSLDINYMTYGDELLVKANRLFEELEQNVRNPEIAREYAREQIQRLHQLLNSSSSYGLLESVQAEAHRVEQSIVAFINEIDAFAFELMNFTWLRERDEEIRRLELHQETHEQQCAKRDRYHEQHRAEQRRQAELAQAAQQYLQETKQTRVERLVDELLAWVKEQRPEHHKKFEAEISRIYKVHTESKKGKKRIRYSKIEKELKGLWDRRESF